MIGGAALALAGCNTLPRPFAHEGPVTENQLLDLPSGKGVRVVVTPKLPPAVAAAAVKALTDAGIPASSDPFLSRGFVLRADVVVEEPDDGRPETAEVVWKLHEPDGRPIGKIDQRIGGGEAGWIDSDPGPLTSAARDAGKQVVAYFQRRAEVATVDGATEAAVAFAEPRLYFSGVTGAPGDGNESLKRALTYILRQAGMPFADSSETASHQLNGRVEATPKGQGISDVSVVWQLTDRDGQEVSKISQRNPVPTANLERRWGELAFQVSGAAADGVLDAFATVSQPVDRRPLALPPR